MLRSAGGGSGNGGCGGGSFQQQLLRHYTQQPPQPPRPQSYREQKAEKSNRYEGRRLETRLKVMEKEREHKRHVGSVEKHSILRQVEEIHRTTGYSPLGVRPDRGDQALRESAYFTTGRKLSEKALSRWKLHEALAERELRLTGQEVRRRQDQQEALNRLLLDLGVIERRRPTLASSSFEATGASSRLRHGRSQSTPPVVVDESGAGNGRGTVGWKARAAARAEAVAASAAAAADGLSNSRLARADAVAALSRLADRQSRMFNERGELVRKATIAGPRSASASAAQPSNDKKMEKNDEEDGAEEEAEEESSDESDEDAEDGDTIGPQWMRQLKCEAPPGLNEPRRRATRVQLTVSRSSLKQQLKDLLDSQGRRGALRLPAMRVVRRSTTE